MYVHLAQIRLQRLRAYIFAYTFFFLLSSIHCWNGKFPSSHGLHYLFFCTFNFTYIKTCLVRTLDELKQNGEQHYTFVQCCCCNKNVIDRFLAIIEISLGSGLLRFKRIKDAVLRLAHYDEIECLSVVIHIEDRQVF